MLILNFRTGLILAAITSTLFLAGCGEKRETIQLAGSSTVAPLAIEIGKRFEAKNPNVRVEVQTGGSSRGIADARTGKVDCGMSSRGLKDSEKDGVQSFTIAMDGVCFIIHSENPVKTLTRDQLLGIYTGKITNWQQVGGDDAEITCINRAAGRSELELVTKFFGIEAGDIQADTVAGENQQGIKMVANDKNAITYMSVGASEYEAQNGTSIQLLPLDGVAASVETVRNGTFPLSRPLIYITALELNPLTQAFVDYSLSADVHDLVEEFSYVPVAR